MNLRLSFFFNKASATDNELGSDDDSADLIRQELAKPPSYAKLHYSSSITKNNNNSFGYHSHTNVTPSSTVAHSASKRCNSNDASYFSDSDSWQTKPKARKRACRSRCNRSSSNSIKRQSESKHSLQLFEKEKIRDDVKDKGYETTKDMKLLKGGLPLEIAVSKGSICDSAVDSSYSHLLLDPSPNSEESKQLCIYCHSRGDLCHEKRYSSYCYHATYAYLQDKEQGLFAGFSPARMESVYMAAYNEVRRSDMWMRFGYYTPGWLKVPKCMELKSMKISADLGYDPNLCSNLEKENEDGRSCYFRARSDNKS